MSTPDVHTLTGAYAVDALDHEEREAFHAHLGECDSCRDEVGELRATTTRLALAAATAAPLGLRARVLAQAARTRQLSPLGDVVRLAERRSPWYRQPASAAAALLLVVSAGLGAVAVSEHRQADRAQLRADRIVAIATDPDSVKTVLPVSTGGTATVVAAGDDAVFRTSGLPELPEDQAFQLWILRPEGPQSVGVLGRGGALEAFVQDMGSAEGLGLTIEPSGGSIEPTGELVLRVPMA